MGSAQNVVNRKSSFSRGQISNGALKIPEERFLIHHITPVVDKDFLFAGFVMLQQNPQMTLVLPYGYQINYNIRDNTLGRKGWKCGKNRGTS